MMFAKLLLDKEMMMVEIIDKNVFKIMTLLNNLILVWRFVDHNLVFCSLYTTCEICFLLEYGS